MFTNLMSLLRKINFSLEPNMADVGKSWLPFVPFEKFMKYKFPFNAWIKDVVMSIAIFHGTEDWIVPYKSGLKLSKTAHYKLTDKHRRRRP